MENQRVQVIGHLNAVIQCQIWDLWNIWEVFIDKHHVTLSPSEQNVWQPVLVSEQIDAQWCDKCKVYELEQCDTESFISEFCVLVVPVWLSVDHVWCKFQEDSVSEDQSENTHNYGEKERWEKIGWLHKWMLAELLLSVE